MRIYLVAGELSGDRLGASLIQALKQRYPQAQFRGIGGPDMQAQGLHSVEPLETLSVMGLVEVLRHLPQLLRVRRQLIKDAQAWQADLMIGIDAPDFNLGLEKRLKQKGIKTAHFVSPSVWAWRQGRLKSIKRSIDLMLTLFPFEADFYQRHQIPVAFVGHPAADRLPLVADPLKARTELQIAPQARVVALLPGSRQGEVERLGPVFLQTAQKLKLIFPELIFVLPAATPARYQQLAQLLKTHPVEDLLLLQGQSDLALQASDACLLASGTITLEALFCKCPMVVAYRLAPLSWWILKRLVKLDWVSLPNLLAQKPLVTERLQEAATPAQLAEDLGALLNQPEQANQQTQAFYQLHQQLQRHAGQQAALALEFLLSERDGTTEL